VCTIIPVGLILFLTFLHIYEIITVVLNLFSGGTGDDRNGYSRDFQGVKPRANDPIAVKEKFIHAKVCLVDHGNNLMALFCLDFTSFAWLFLLRPLWR